MSRFQWSVFGGSWGSFEFDPYTMTEYNPWGKQVSAPDGSLMVIGAGMIKVKFKMLPIRQAKDLTKQAFKHYVQSWHEAQQTTGGKMEFLLWNPQVLAWENVTGIPKWPDPSGHFYGPYLMDWELEIYAPNLPESWTGGPVNILPIGSQPPVYNEHRRPGGFGLGRFGKGQYGKGETSI